MIENSARRFAAEAVGTALLVATVIGSGIMAERLAGGNVALALLGNTLSTGASWLCWSRYSGRSPARTSIQRLVWSLWWRRSGLSGRSWRSRARIPTPWHTRVGLYIAGAYWFTASTSFANPAITLARSLTDSFAGIAPTSVAGFVLAQLAGAGLALLFFRWLLDSPRIATQKP